MLHETYALSECRLVSLGEDFPAALLPPAALPAWRSQSGCRSHNDPRGKLLTCLLALKVLGQSLVFFQAGRPFRRLVNRTPEACSSVFMDEGRYLDYLINGRSQQHFPKALFSAGLSKLCKPPACPFSR